MLLRGCRQFPWFRSISRNPHATRQATKIMNKPKLVVGHEVAWVDGHPGETATILEVLDRADHHGQRLYGVQPHSPDPEVEIFAGALPERELEPLSDGVIRIAYFTRGGKLRIPVTVIKAEPPTTVVIQRDAVPPSGGFNVINATNDAVRVQVAAASWGGLADELGQVRPTRLPQPVHERHRWWR